MKEYFYSDGKTQHGAVDLDELKKIVQPKMLVWKNGMKQWEKAENLPELKGHFVISPPPLPLNTNNTQTSIPLIPPNLPKKTNPLKWVLISLSSLILITFLYFYVATGSFSGNSSYSNNDTSTPLPPTESNTINVPPGAVAKYSSYNHHADNVTEYIFFMNDESILYTADNIKNHRKMIKRGEPIADTRIREYNTIDAKYYTFEGSPNMTNAYIILTDRTGNVIVIDNMDDRQTYKPY
jgi:hypothetical protein